MFFLARLPLLIQSDVLFSNISAEELPSESVINKRKSYCHFSWRNGSTAVWMFVHPTYTAVIFVLKGFLINQKLFLSTSEYHHNYQGRMWNMPDFWNRHNNYLSKVYRFLLPSSFCSNSFKKKTSSQKILFALSTMRNTKGWLTITHVNFTMRRTEVNFQALIGSVFLRTQLTVFVGGVCLRSRKIFSALFSRNNFFTRRGHFKELQVKGNLFDCSKIWTVASFT